MMMIRSTLELSKFGSDRRHFCCGLRVVPSISQCRQHPTLMGRGVLVSSTASRVACNSNFPHDCTGFLGLICAVQAYWLLKVRHDDEASKMWCSPMQFARVSRLPSWRGVHYRAVSSGASNNRYQKACCRFSLHAGHMYHGCMCMSIRFD